MVLTLEDAMGYAQENSPDIKQSRLVLLPILSNPVNQLFDAPLNIIPNPLFADAISDSVLSDAFERLTPRRELLLATMLASVLLLLRDSSIP